MKLIKKAILLQMEMWIQQMNGKAEWSAVQRHLYRAMVGTQDLIKRNK